MIIVDHNQSLLDLAVQHGGNVTDVMNLAIANDISITDQIRPSTELVAVDQQDPNMVNFLAVNNYVPATLSKVDAGIEPNGIGAWVIELDFTVVT